MKDLIPVSITGIHSPQETWIMIIYQKKIIWFQKQERKRILYAGLRSERKLKLFALFHESGILHFHNYPWGSQNPLSDKSKNLGFFEKISYFHFVGSLKTFFDP